MQCAFLFQKNVKDLMDSNGIRILVDLLTLAHLHVSRATVPLQVRSLSSFSSFVFFGYSVRITSLLEICKWVYVHSQ